VSKLSAELSIVLTISFPEKELIRSLAVCKKFDIVLSFELVLFLVSNSSSGFELDLFGSSSSSSSSIFI
jgi:hypothetical protein